MLENFAGISGHHPDDGHHHHRHRVHRDRLYHDDVVRVRQHQVRRHQGHRGLQVRDHGRVHRVLRHQPVRRPLPPAHRQQAVRFQGDDVVPGRGRGGGRGARASLSRRSPSPSLTSSASDLAVALSIDARTPARLPQPSAAAVEAAQALQVEHSRFLKCCVGEFGKLVSFVVKDENFAPQWRSVISNQGAPYLYMHLC